MSVLSYLESLAGDALHLPGERRQVREATEKLASRIRMHFGDQVVEHFKFGSTVRGTNLPKAYADEMDVDYLVVFRDRSLTPKSLVRKVVDFAQAAYPNNEVFQSSPAAVVVLKAVRFEIVPARETLTGIFDSHEIPNGSATAWVGTSPRGFEDTLMRRNGECHGKLKAAIRLVKMWNVENGYVYGSYLLEKFAVDRLYPGDSNLRDYFCRLMLSLPEDSLDAKWRLDRVRAGKARLRKALDQEAGGKAARADKTLDQLFGVY